MKAEYSLLLYNKQAEKITEQRRISYFEKKTETFWF